MGKINDVMESYHGRFVPMFQWENHEPMKIWYDEKNHSICVDCGISKKIPCEAELFDESTYDTLLNELENEIIYYFNGNGIDLFGVKD